MINYLPQALTLCALIYERLGDSGYQITFFIHFSHPLSGYTH